MKYEIKLEFFAKTFGKSFTPEQIINLCKDKLWDIKEFRDIEIFSFRVDPETYNEKQENYHIHLTCPKCKQIEVVSLKNAREWKCNMCEG